MRDGIVHWPCNPRVSGSNPYASNLKKLFIWMKIHGLTQTIILQMAKWILGNNDTLAQKQSGSSRFFKCPRIGNVLKPKGPPGPAGFEILPIRGLL